MKVIRDAKGLAVDYEVGGDWPAYGNNDEPQPGSEPGSRSEPELRR